MAVSHQAAHDVRAHPAQANHAELHAPSLYARKRDNGGSGRARPADAGGCDRCCAGRSQVSDIRDTLEIHEAVGAFERLDAWLRARGFFAPGGEELVADLYLGYGLSSTIRRQDSDAPPEPCPLRSPPVPSGREDYVANNDNFELDAARPATLSLGPGDGPGLRATTRPRSFGCAMRSRAATSIRSTSSAPGSGVRGRSGRARRPPRNPEPPQSRALPRRRLVDRVRLTRALPRAARPPCVDVPDQGHASGWSRGGARAGAVGEGRRRARDDRRSRAQRPVARVRAGERALARADGDARAGGSRAHGLDRGGPAARRSRSSRSSSVRRSPGGRSGAPKIAAVDLIAEIEPVGAGRRWARWVASRQRRPRSGPDDPDVRDRRGADPPLGRRRCRVGLGSAGGDRGVVGEG